MSTTPNQPYEPDGKPEPSDEEAAAAHDALSNLGDKPHADEAGATAYSAVPPPLPPLDDPAQEPVQDTIPGMPQQPPPEAEARAQAPQQQPPQSPFVQGSPYAQQPPPQEQPPVYGQQQPYGAQYSGTTGQYTAAPPPPPYGYGQPYGYPDAGLPTGMPPLADYGQRAGAFALDNGLAIVAGWVTGTTRSHAVDIVFGLIGLVGIVWAVLNALRAGRSGQSYGKRTMGIRLARLADGQPVGAGIGFLRLFLDWILWVACVVPGVLNLLWPLWDRTNQTWADKLAKSVVVKTR